MQPKIMFTDIDGTLLNSDRQLSEKTIATIQQLKEEIPIVLISARMPSAMRHLQKQLGLEDQPIICYNGGFVIIDGQVASSTFIPVDTIQKLIQFNEKTKVHLSLYHGDEWHVPEYDYWAKREERNTKVTPNVRKNSQVINDWEKREIGAHKIMCMGEEENIEELFQFLKNNYGDDLHVYRSKSTYIEIANRTISKLTAIDYLLKNHYHIPLEDALAFGDNYNDVEMLEGVGYGVAVANGRDECKNVANKVCEASIEDGVAKTLEQLYFN